MLKMLIKNKNLMRNKKGDIAVTLLVFMAILVTGIALFSFITNSNKIIGEIKGLNEIDKVYLEKNQIEFYLRQAGETALIKEYQEFVGNHGYIKNPMTTSEGYVIFREIWEDINQRLEREFTDKLKLEFGKYDIKDIPLDNVRSEVHEDLVILKIDNFNIEASDVDKKIKLNYNPKIIVMLNITQSGLHSFQEIYEVKEDCKDDDSIKQCFSDNMLNFEVKEENAVIILTSKKQFLINEEFKKIEFSFIPE